MLKIEMKVDADFTPKGKRSVRVVTLLRGTRCIRWYVGGRIWRQIALTAENMKLSEEWFKG